MREKIQSLINTIDEYVDILVYKLAIWRIKKGYGADCPDYADKCPSCEAKTAVDWLEEAIKTIKGIY